MLVTAMKNFQKTDRPELLFSPHFILLSIPPVLRYRSMNGHGPSIPQGERFVLLKNF
jgi:hypothetical protein